MTSLPVTSNTNISTTVHLTSVKSIFTICFQCYLSKHAFIFIINTLMSSWALWNLCTVGRTTTIRTTTINPDNKSQCLKMFKTWVGALNETRKCWFCRYSCKFPASLIKTVSSISLSLPPDSDFHADLELRLILSIWTQPSLSLCVVFCCTGGPLDLLRLG